MFNKLHTKNLTLAHKHILVILFFALLTTTLIFSWFRYGYLYGGGDVGLPSYNSPRILEIAKFIWWEASAPGITVPQGLTSVPIQFFQSILHNLGLPSVLVQAVLFWILLFSMGYGMFWLALTIFGKDKFFLAILAGLFYMFNPYMMISVWHRFIHNTFFLAASMPMLILFWKKWIETGRYTALLGFLLVNLIAVYFYGTIAFIFTILIILTFIVFTEALFPWKGIKRAKILFFRFLFGFVIWVLAHSWWLLPVVKISPAALSVQHTLEDSLSTLLSISQQSVIPHVVLGINPFYLFDQAEWGPIFNTPFFLILPWLMLIFIIPGLIKSLRSNKTLRWGLLWVLAIFLAKGAADPFGYLYILGFSNLFALGALRNPFEKLGILIPLSSSILFALGVGWYIEYARLKWRSHLKIFFLNMGILLVIILLMVVYLWPFWTGHLFGRVDKPAFINIPQGYVKANDYIKNQNQSGKILHLPLTAGEAVTYYWQYGYNGVEPSQLLFSLPSISHGFNLNFVDDSLNGLSRILSVAETNYPDKILNLLQVFNVRFIVLHKDIEWRGGNLDNPVKLKEILDQLNFLIKVADFGELTVYRLKDEFFVPRLSIAKNVQYLVYGKKNEYWPWLLRSNLGDFISTAQNLPDQKLFNKSEEIVIIPDYSHNYYIQRSLADNAVDQLPAVKILPSSSLYVLVRLKENVLYFTNSGTDRFAYLVKLSSKRLVEAYKMKEKGFSVASSVKSYQNSLPGLMKGLQSRGIAGLSGGEISLESIFEKHFAILEHILNQSSGEEKQIVQATLDSLKSGLIDVGVLPRISFKDGRLLSSFNKLVSRFQIPSDGKYEILLAHQNAQSIYNGQLLEQEFQVDGNIETLSGKRDGFFNSFGTIDLTSGIHEIGFIATQSANLTSSYAGLEKTRLVNITDNEIEINSDIHDSGWVDLDIKPVTGGGWYQLSWESWIKKGDKYKVQLIQDTDPEDLLGEEGKLYSFNKLYTRDPYLNQWNRYETALYLRVATSLAKIRLLVDPWDDCNVIVVTKELCESKKFRYPYEHPSTVIFRNFKVTRVLNNPIFLRSKNDVNSNTTVPHIDFSQKNTVFYQGRIILSEPGFVVFSETYNPGWKLIIKDSNGKDVPVTKYLANLFANAWYIDRVGEFSFELKFTPQDYVQQGLIVATLAWLGVIVLMIRQKKGVKK